jgi:hypothetical protein
MDGEIALLLAEVPDDRLDGLVVPAVGAAVVDAAEGLDTGSDNARTARQNLSTTRVLPDRVDANAVVDEAITT